MDDIKFPSPLGVIFSLIKDADLLKECTEFPSPLGVIFSLINMKKIKRNKKEVFSFPSPLGVIFSLILVSSTHPN